MQREDPLHPDSVRDLAHGEGGAVAAAVDLDDDALEGLDAFLFPLDHLDLKPDRVTDPKLGQVFAQATLFELLDNAVHWKSNPRSRALQHIAKRILAQSSRRYSMLG